MINEHYTVRQAATLLGLKKKTLVARIERGRVTATKLDDRLWLIEKAEVERLQRQETQRKLRKSRL